MSAASCCRPLHAISRLISLSEFQQASALHSASKLIPCIIVQTSSAAGSVLLPANCRLGLGFAARQLQGYILLQQAAQQLQRDCWVHSSSIANLQVGAGLAAGLRTPVRDGITHSFCQTGLRRCTSSARQSKQPKVMFAARQKPRFNEQALYLTALVVSMVGLTYASVPLYRMFCQATGFGGTVQQGRTVEDKLRERVTNPVAEMEAAAAARQITVSFDGSVTDGMPWRFYPTQQSVKLSPGQSTLAFYTAHNTSDKAITGVSTYNVSPDKAGIYFNKIQCFCFEEQKLRPGEKVDMPVFFYIDPEFATDRRMDGVNHLTLSYTFFKVDEEAAEEEEEEE